MAPGHTAGATALGPAAGEVPHLEESNVELFVDVLDIRAVVNGLSIRGNSIGMTLIAGCRLMRNIGAISGAIQMVGMPAAGNSRVVAEDPLVAVIALYGPFIGTGHGVPGLGRVLEQPGAIGMAVGNAFLSRIIGQCPSSGSSAPPDNGSGAVDVVSDAGIAFEGGIIGCRHGLVVTFAASEVEAEVGCTDVVDMRRMALGSNRRCRGGIATMAAGAGGGEGLGPERCFSSAVAADVAAPASNIVPAESPGHAIARQVYEPVGVLAPVAYHRVARS